KPAEPAAPTEPAEQAAPSEPAEPAASTEPAEPAAPACCNARHTRSGVQGMGTSWTPYGRSASTMAFTTAGVEAMVPASPTPLTPSGLLVAGVSVRSLTISGRSAALGMV